MLREIRKPRQVAGEQPRRWFASPKCDLIVWLRDDGSPDGFQFCYDKDDREHALTWTQSLGFSHMRVDTGSPPFSHKGTPLLVEDGVYNALKILEIFRRESESLPAEYVTLIADKLRELGGE